MKGIFKKKKRTKSVMFTQRVYPETAKFLRKVDLDLLVIKLKRIKK